MIVFWTSSCDDDWNNENSISAARELIVQNFTIS